MGEHTPGPWELRRLEYPTGSYWILHQEQYGDIARISDWQPNSHANAAIMLASPDLLEACETFVNAQTEEDHMTGLLQARAAIDRAKS